MILDESIDDDLFVVGGVVTTNERVIEQGILAIKKKVKNSNIKGKIRDKILNEVKDHYLNRNLSKFKKEFFQKIKDDEDTMLISVYMDNDRTLSTEDKYIMCLKKILDILKLEIENLNIKIKCDNIPRIKYDQFQSKTFKNKLNEIKNKYNIEHIEEFNSQATLSIQGADLSVGLMRRLLRKELIEFEDLIKNKYIIQKYINKSVQAS